MQKINWKLLLLSASLAVTAIFQMGYANAYPNTAITTFRTFMNVSYYSPMEMTAEQFQWKFSGILSIYFIGFTGGSLLSASLADRIGRRYTLLLGTVLSFISVIVAMVSILLSASSMFGLSRLIMSFAAAISMNSLILLFQESSPSHMRGLISFNAEMAFVLTNMVGGLFGMQSVFGSSLVAVISISLLPSFASIILVLYIQESPKFLYLKRNDIEEASRALRFYQGIWEDDEKAAVFKEYKLEKEGNGKMQPGSIWDMLKVSSTMTGVTLGFFTMQLTVSVWPIIFYSTDFLTDAGFSSEIAENVSTVMLFVSTISTVIGMMIVEKLPRRVLLISTGSVNVLALLGFSLSAFFAQKYQGNYIEYGCIVFIILHGISYSIALGPIAWFITSELVPISHRAASQCLVLAANHTSAMVFSFVTFPMVKENGPLVLIFLFVLPGIGCLLLLILRLPETKDRHINEIVYDLTDPADRPKPKRVRRVRKEERIEMRHTLE